MISTQPWWKILLFALIGNTLIALTIWLVGNFTGFFSILVATQCMGLSICYAHILFDWWLVGWQDRLAGRLGISVLAVITGVLVGIMLAWALGVTLPAEMFFSDWEAALHSLGTGALFTVPFLWFFRSQERIKQLELARQAAELREMTGQKEALAARLRLLQAQIEPHFLFNTLANLHSLIGRDDRAARNLLEQINNYLRASLVHSRAQGTTLGDECRLLEAYLGIQTQRMGGRLTWEMTVPATLRRLPFPPMLLQPLVENAIRHGLEPKIGPGHLRIAAREVEDEQIMLTVEDDGLGLTGKPHASGFGLTNVRERLATLFGSSARFCLVENSPAGLTAQLWLPKDALVP